MAAIIHVDRDSVEDGNSGQSDLHDVRGLLDHLTVVTTVLRETMVQTGSPPTSHVRRSGPAAPARSTSIGRAADVTVAGTPVPETRTSSLGIDSPFSAVAALFTNPPDDCHINHRPQYEHCELEGDGVKGPERGGPNAKGM